METIYKDARKRDSIGFSYDNDFPAGDNIASSVWDPDIGITLDTPTFSATLRTTSIWYSGGVPRGQYLVRNYVTSVAGRTAQNTFLIIVTDDAA